MKMSNDMSDFKKRLTRIIKESNLDTDQKLLWDLFLEFASSHEDEAVHEAITDDKENLEYLTKYLRDKVWDMKENNTKTWKKLIQKETKYATLLG
jgi:hypothetical protein